MVKADVAFHQIVNKKLKSFVDEVLDGMYMADQRHVIDSYHLQNPTGISSQKFSNEVWMMASIY